MAFRYAVVAILAGAITTFALQNNAPTSVRFLVWTLDNVPLAGVILLALAVGLVLAGVPLLYARLRYRSRVRALEAQMTDLRARQATTPPPSRPRSIDRPDPTP